MCISTILSLNAARVHRFSLSLRCRNKECPTCRKKLVSKRSLRADPNFDALISKMYPSRDEYEAHQDKVLEQLSRLHNKEALSSSIEQGLRMQARHRSKPGPRPCDTFCVQISEHHYFQLYIWHIATTTKIVSIDFLKVTTYRVPKKIIYRL